MTAALKALEALRRNVAGRGGAAAADWALTLHMLEHLAPGFFSAQTLRPELDDALARLDELPPRFDERLPVSEAMARVDARYLRRVRGLPRADLDAASFSQWIDANAADVPLHAWLMIELARECGVTHAPVLRSRYPFKLAAPIAHLYMLTHEVMLDTRYFARPVSLSDAPRICDELEAALPWCVEQKLWDLTAEVSFTLGFGGRDVSLGLDAVARAQRPDGAMVDDGPIEERTHTIATALIALAAQQNPPPPPLCDGVTI